LCVAVATQLILPEQSSVADAAGHYREVRG
jgi:hypothetical protein